MKILVAFFYLVFGLISLGSFAGLLALAGTAAVGTGWQAGLAVLVFGFPFVLVISLIGSLFIRLVPLR
jgi:hypothetical protein